jgi:hypothetical protein
VRLLKSRGCAGRIGTKPILRFLLLPADSDARPGSTSPSLEPESPPNLMELVSMLTLRLAAAAIKAFGERLEQTSRGPACSRWRGAINMRNTDVFAD